MNIRTRQLADAFLATRRLKGLSNRTLEGYQHHLTKLEAVSPRLPVKPSVIEHLLAELPGGQHNKATFFRTLNAFFNWAERQRGLQNPMQYVTRPRLPNKIMPTLEKVDIMLLLALVEQHPRDKALIYLFLDNGVRPSEAVNLRTQDIKDDYILVDGKVGQRLVPLSGITRDLLLALPPDANGYIFFGNKSRLTRSGAYRLVNRYLTRIGYTGGKKGPYVLRHTVGRWFLMNGGDMRSLQLLLGHQSIKTTEKYASLAMADIIEKHHKFTLIKHSCPEPRR